MWLYSYEMNLELEIINEFRPYVMTKVMLLPERHAAAADAPWQKPEGWTDEDAFWNLVACVHLENCKYTAEYRPVPVKIPLRMGEFLLMDFMNVHAGMPFVQGQKSLRGHVYWAQVAGRCALHSSACALISSDVWVSRQGDSAKDHTTPVWATYHPYYPGWKIISEQRRHFE